VSGTPREGDVMVRVEELSRSFGRFVAVDRVSFTVPRGEVFGFLGSNGAGKTTTIRMLCGLLTPSSGRATVAGCNVVAEARALRRRIGYMSQRFSLYRDLTVAENLSFWGSAYRLWGARLSERSRWALEMAGLEAQRDVVVRDLPGGFRQRLALGCALLHEPPVVFLDEPTGGVDPQARRRFWDVIDDLAARGTTVFVTTHVMDEAERCHRVALMHNGRLLALDTPAGLKAGLGGAVVLEVACPRAPRAVAVLEGIDGVSDTALFGDRLHVVVDGAAEVTAIRAKVEAAGHRPATVRAIDPSLEDVFIHVIRQAELGEGAPCYAG
jgi:ABC-2 type transport system ATP-binding protein